MRQQGGSEAGVVSWPPSKELEARKHLREGKNFASEAASGVRRRARGHCLPWGARHALVRLGEVGDHLRPDRPDRERPLRQAEGG